MPPVEFEPTISAGERPQTYALDHVATRIGREVKNPKSKGKVLPLHAMKASLILNIGTRWR